MLSSPAFSTPTVVHMSLFLCTSLVFHLIRQAINPYTVVSAYIFSLASPSRTQATETLAEPGTVVCSGHEPYDKQYVLGLGQNRIKKEVGLVNGIMNQRL